jgi:RecA/RadA recombinase
MHANACIVLLTILSVAIGCRRLVRLNSIQDNILTCKAQLVIIDSIASLIRKEFENDSHYDRSDLLAREATILKSA